MRLIDADELLKGHEDHEMISTHLIWNAPTIDAVSVDEWCHDCKEYDKEKHSCPRFNRVIRTALKDADMVSVVRCKDCKYAEVYDGYYTQVCCENGVIGGHGELWNPDDFCSYGERKDHE